MRLRSTLPVACVLVLGMGLAGCGKEAPPPATAYADPVALAAYQRTSFATELERMDAAVQARQPYSGDQPLNATYTGYQHVSLGKETYGEEVRALIAGQPPALQADYASDREGNTLNSYHPAGSVWTYYLLGDRYTSIAPTLWVAVAYEEPKGGDAPYTKAYCSTVPLNHVCTIRGAITATAASSRAAEAQQHVTHDADGHTELRTQVTWDSLVNNPLSSIVLPYGVEDDIPSGIGDELVPIRLWLDDRGFPIKGEINIAYGDDGEFQLQTGFEYVGPSSESDFITPPSVLDVTQMEASAFFGAVSGLDAEAEE